MAMRRPLKMQPGVAQAPMEPGLRWLQCAPLNFDQIFINKRFEQNLIPAKLGYTDEYGITFHNFFHLDLFALVRSCTNFNKFLPDLKQKTVEKYLNIDENRDDLISGAESVTLYDRYMSSRDESILNQILLHNSDDCIQLAYLTKLFGYPLSRR